MCKFEENVQKPDFWAKNGQIWQKSDVRISRYRVTDARTDARTHERESIGPSANAERPKTCGPYCNKLTNVFAYKKRVYKT